MMILPPYMQRVISRMILDLGECAQNLNIHYSDIRTYIDGIQTSIDNENLSLFYKLCLHINEQKSPDITKLLCSYSKEYFDSFDDGDMFSDLIKNIYNAYNEEFHAYSSSETAAGYSSAETDSDNSLSEQGETYSLDEQSLRLKYMTLIVDTFRDFIPATEDDGPVWF